MPSPSRTPERRVVANRRYRDGPAQAGIVKITVVVPTDRVAQLQAITAAWRAEARLHQAADRPSAELILRLHGVCWVLRLPPPVRAFETRLLATEWLAKHEKQLLTEQADVSLRRRKPANGEESSCSTE